MTIWYIFGFIISASFATLMIMVQIRLRREQKETREKAIIQAEKEAKAGSTPESYVTNLGTSE